MRVQVYFVPCQTMGEGWPFWSERAYIYPLNYLLQVGVMSAIIKVFIVLVLLCLWE